MNKVILMGRLTADPELRTTGNDTSVCTFTVAVDRRFKSDNGPSADFIRVVAWRQTAEFVNKYFSKGNRIAVVGSIQTRTWDDKDGKRQYATEVVADEVEFCESKRQDGTAGGFDRPRSTEASAPRAEEGFVPSAPAQEEFYPSEVEDGNQIPF